MTPLVFNCRTDGKIIPLIGADVDFELISKSTNKRVLGGKCEIVDMANGTAKYTFKEGELGEGEYQGRVRIDLSQGARREALALDIKVVDSPK